MTDARKTSDPMVIEFKTHELDYEIKPGVFLTCCGYRVGREDLAPDGRSTCLRPGCRNMRGV